MTILSRKVVLRYEVRRLNEFQTGSFQFPQHVQPSDSFKISLGADAALRVTYPPARTLNHATPQPGFSLRNRNKEVRRNIVTHSQRITIRNSRQTTVRGLRVLDHLPVSTDTVVKVNMLAPAGLGPTVLPPGEGSNEDLSKDREWVQLRKGLKARWAPMDEGGEGTVEWTCDLGANGEVELELSWDVSAPLGQKWVTM